ncbi:MAG: hypothetical protein Q4G26_14310 [Paracoccus sp. (in: a-proteobacteria)]|nr:hypothetical protein [Paracoccus sp. (in: a-proteobacteria)]
MSRLGLVAGLGLALALLAGCQRDAEIGLSAERAGPMVLNPQAPPPAQ